MMDCIENRHGVLARLAVAKRDIEQARTMAALVLERAKNTDDPYFAALERATVMSYGRPFFPINECPGLPSAYSELPTAELQELHAHLLQRRNEFMAPSEAGWNGSAAKGVRVLVDGEELEVAQQASALRERQKLPSFAISAFPLIHHLCSLQVERLEAEIASHSEALTSTLERATTDTAHLTCSADT